MSSPGDPGHPYSAAALAAVPAETTLLRRRGLVISAGGVTAAPGGFGFTLLILIDVDLVTADPVLAMTLDGLREPDMRSWLSVRYATGGQSPDPDVPRLSLLEAESSDNRSWHRSRWQVTPEPPPGPVEITIRLAGRPGVSGTGHLNGRVIAEAARQVVRADEARPLVRSGRRRASGPARRAAGLTAPAGPPRGDGWMPAGQA